jgi:GT2 family glycosyltransferase
MTENTAIDIIVPIYRNASVTKRCIDSILEHILEIRKFTPRLIAVNDSPDDRDVDAVLAELAAANPDIMILKNTTNCGFVKTVNRALAISCRDGHDVILINSDTLTFDGTLANLVDAAYSDPQIGFACPRSNNASICSLPHLPIPNAGVSPKEAYIHWEEISATLPRVHFTPTAIGFYLFVKHDILARFGGLREEYGVGYHEENDLIMRANKHGYRAVFANRSFAFHVGSVSFELLDIDLDAHKKENTDKLLAMYPEFGPLIAGYISSAHFRGEALLTGLVGHRSGRIKLVIDLSDFDWVRDETGELALSIIKSLAGRHARLFELSALCSDEAFVNHRLPDFGNVTHVDQLDPGKHAIAIRLGSPCGLHDIRLLESVAPINIFGFGETIDANRGGPSGGTCATDHLRHVARHANGLIFTSRVSELDFFSAFPDAQALPVYTRLLSTKVPELNNAVERGAIAGWDDWIDGLADFLERSLNRDDLFRRLCNRLDASDRLYDADRKEAAYGTEETLASLLQHEGRQFIEKVYLTVLRRPADSAGLRHHLALLRKGVPKLQIIVGMRESPEGKRLDCELEGLREAIAKYRSSRLKAIRSLVEFWR